MHAAIVEEELIWRGQLPMLGSYHTTMQQPIGSKRAKALLAASRGEKIAQDY